MKDMKESKEYENEQLEFTESGEEILPEQELEAVTGGVRRRSHPTLASDDKNSPKILRA